ncbi:MAG: glutamate--tRNA ligase [Nitrososphaera sp.]
MSSDGELGRLLLATALKNAVEHSGKAQFEAVMAKVIGARPDLRSTIKSIIPEIRAVVEKVNSMSPGAQKTELEQLTPAATNASQPTQKSTEPRSLSPLNGAVRGQVVTRFPPEPNGYPHIGHAKAAIIDEEYARMYEGRLVLRFDDTNPAKEKLEYYDAIREGLDWLGVKPDAVKNTSDDIQILQNLGKKMVEAGGAYVCTCDVETIHALRAKGLACPCRDDESANLERLDMMFGGRYQQNDAIIRFKGNMADDNTAMRDPTLFRIIEGNHPLLGDKIRVWPTYDFAAPIEDSLDGVTHAMRTKEYELRNELYFAILDRLSLRKPQMIEFSRLEFEGVPVSKRKLKPLIENGSVSGWDDPRLPTLAAFRRRGFRPEAIRKFVLSLGITLAETKPPFEALEAYNRKLIDPVAPRLFFVEDPIPVEIEGLEPRKITLKNHPTDASLGTRELNISSNTVFIQKSDASRLRVSDDVRLIELCNIKVTEIEGGSGAVKATAATSQEITQAMPKIQWVAKNDILDFEVLMPKPLYAGEEYNPNSLQVASGFAESYVASLGVGSILQFVRFGFCRIDSRNRAILTHK